ncbi:hypothetical protein PITCH_A680005 [uncultured Desulfobacterium sp.]|uniref:Uncharacterized protein n=1 Tax=uncultured Desulfobacterium sp. TaxID=201089 RepID=A0A445N1N0_9BACT|nr:hypothetical protein PITCH_A680005 [uncultured Desulfobacterium sp.]
MDSRRRGQWKTGRPPVATETGEVSAPGKQLRAGRPAHGRVLVRAAPATAWEEETGAHLAAAMGVAGANAWRAREEV